MRLRTFTIGSLTLLICSFACADERKVIDHVAEATRRLIQLEKQKHLVVGFACCDAGSAAAALGQDDTSLDWAIRVPDSLNRAILANAIVDRRILRAARFDSAAVTPQIVKREIERIIASPLGRSLSDDEINAAVWRVTCSTVAIQQAEHGDWSEAIEMVEFMPVHEHRDLYLGSLIDRAVELGKLQVAQSIVARIEDPEKRKEEANAVAWRLALKATTAKDVAEQFDVTEAEAKHEQTRLALIEQGGQRAANEHALAEATDIFDRIVIRRMLIDLAEQRGDDKSRTEIANAAVKELEPYAKKPTDEFFTAYDALIHAAVFSSLAERHDAAARFFEQARDAHRKKRLLSQHQKLYVRALARAGRFDDAFSFARSAEKLDDRERLLRETAVAAAEIGRPAQVDHVVAEVREKHGVVNAMRVVAAAAEAHASIALAKMKADAEKARQSK